MGKATIHRPRNFFLPDPQPGLYCSVGLEVARSLPNSIMPYGVSLYGHLLPENTGLDFCTKIELALETSRMSQESKIKVLPPLVVRKIAAGEVVERPASVVKELLDNAVDSGATHIAVEIKGGGKELIRVTDNGCGIAAHELTLAITPHATSKIVDDNDLFAIQSMGFRGEALASISAVSRMRIVSRTADDDEAHEIQVEAEAVRSSHATGAPPGTTIEVRDLFFNVPARRAFLRTPSTETGHINEQFTRTALAYPSVAFELINNGRTTHQLPACENRLERLSRFYGPELASAFMHTERDERDVYLDAYTAPPTHSRATPSWQYTFVNGRFIRDRFVQHAIREAYRGLMEPKRHGVAFIFLQVDPKTIDVNVHPTKIEIRWQDSRLIHSQVLSALRETFQQADLTPTFRARPHTPIDPAQQQQVREQMADLLKQASPIMPSQAPPSGGGFGSPSSDRFGAPGQMGNHQTSPTSQWEALYKPNDPQQRDYEYDGSPQSGIPLSPLSPDQPQRAIQLHNMYLVSETDEGIIIIDQHALHERIMYEKLRDRIATGSLESQRLLLPETIKATDAYQALIEEHDQLLATLGIEATRFGDDSIAIHAFPAILKSIDVPLFITDLLDRLSNLPAGTTTEVVIHDLLDMMACKAAVKAGDALTDLEIEALLEQRHLVEKSSSCPHGRPTTLRLSKADLNKQFKRT